MPVWLSVISSSCPLLFFTRGFGVSMPAYIADVNGRDELPIPVKAQLDGYYAAHISFALDVKIFFRTIGNVLFGRGIVEGKQQ